MKFGWKAALKFSSIHLCLCCVWIIGSDLFVRWLEHSVYHRAVPELQTYKGLGFVLASSIFLFILKYRHDKQNFQQLEDYRILVEELSIARQQYQQIFNYNPQPLLLYNLAADRIIDVNLAAETRYGYDRNAWLKFKLADIFVNDSANEVYQKFKEFGKSDYSSYMGVYTHTGKDGRVIRVEIFANSLGTEAPNTFIILMKDVSIQIEQLEIIEQRNKQLEEIAWTQSHVIRAPLARIMGLVHLIQQDTSRGEIDPKVLDMFKHSTDELNDVVKRIISQADYS